MKNLYTTLVIGLAIISCKKNDPVTKVDTTPAVSIVCTGPTLADMTGAQKFGDGTVASCTQQALQALINTGGKIQCNCGSSAFTLKLTASVAIPNKEVIIDGGGLFTIDGDNKYRIFDKAPASNQDQGTFFGLQNMSLVNGKAALNKDERGGAAIYGRAFGSIQVINVDFNSNNGPESASDDCGAVHTIVYKSVVFSGCTFKNNNGANGGAVGTIGSGMAFYNCVFDGNKATGCDGTFAKGGSGGAIYVDGTDQNMTPNNEIVLCGCNFINNTAGYQAGAVNIVFYANKGSKATVDKCSFESNSCAKDKGGAYYHMNGPLAISNCTFYKNSSPAQGGGLWTYNTNVTMSNCTFNKNAAVNGTAGLGGAFTLGAGDAKNATITNCTFAENAAGDFATAIFNSGNMTLTNTLFYNNTTGNNPYAGNVINKGTSLDVGNGNLQFPSTYTGQYGMGTDNWINSLVLTSDPKLLSIADNEGPTKTMALPSDSPALNKGTATGAPSTDQRGKPRNGNVDIGAFELQ
jgi:hypothetical protein